MAKNVLVTGATGQQGAAVVTSILALPEAADFTVYNVTRNPSSPAAASLASRGNVEIIQGDLDDPAAMFRDAGVSIWGVFSVQPAYMQVQAGMHKSSNLFSIYTVHNASNVTRGRDSPESYQAMTLMLLLRVLSLISYMPADSGDCTHRHWSLIRV